MTNQLDHCLTDEQLRQLADDAAQFDLDGVEQHLDVCPDCCSRMGAIEQDAEWCEEILPVLRDAETLQEFHASGTGHDLDTQAALRLLGPTDEPQYLGRIGTYEVTGVVGSGGMGIVYKTFDRSLDRFVAIKMMHPHLATSAAARQRFAREAKAAAAVIDDHVLPIYSVDQWQNVPYLVMQYSGGTTLEKRVAMQGPLDIPEVLRIAMQTAHGLAAAHAQGLVHRDVKPSNILIDGTVERALLTDFGLARAVDDGSMTRTGMIAGTPQYMSPEQAHGDQLDHRSDLFSLGSVMYYMLTGRSPFRAETTMGVLNRIGHDDPRSLRSINPQVPVWLEDIVLRLLEKKRDQRYQSAQEVAELLGKWLAHLQQPQNVAPPTETATASSRGVNKQPSSTWQRYLWGAFAVPLVIAAALLLYIETGKGTLKIENNSNAAVPIRILKNNKTVKELTVSTAGATTRLLAGEYIIEIEGNATEYKLAGNEVTLSRGNEWFARIELAPPVTESNAASSIIPQDEDIAALSDNSDWPPFEKTNVANLRRNPDSNPDLDCLIRVDFDSEEGINWLFSDNPVRREPIGPFCVDNVSGVSLMPLIDDDGRRIQMAVKLECGDVKEGIWMCLEGRRIVVNVAQEDFDYVCTGNLLTKVVYLTRGVNDEEFGVLETIASSRLQPGVDPLAEADRRGFPLVSATFSRRQANLNESDRSGLREAHDVDAIQTHSPIKSGPSLRQLIEGRQLEPLGRFRQKLETDAPIRIAGKLGEVVLRPGDTRLVELPNPVLEFYWNQDDAKPSEGLTDFEAFNFVLFEWETNGAFAATAYRSLIHRSLTTGDVEWRQAQTLMNQSLLKQQLTNLDRIKELKLSELGRKEVQLHRDGPIYLTGTKTIIRRGESMLIALSAPTRKANWSQEGVGNTHTLQDTIEFDYILCEWQLDGTFIAKAYRSPRLDSKNSAEQSSAARIDNEQGVRELLQAFKHSEADYSPCVIDYRIWVTKPSQAEERILDSFGFAHSAQEFTCRYEFDGKQAHNKIRGYTVKGKRAEIPDWLKQDSSEQPSTPFQLNFHFGHSSKSPLHWDELLKNAGQMKYVQDTSNPRIALTPRLCWTTEREGVDVQVELGFMRHQDRWVPSLVKSQMLDPDNPDKGMAIENQVEKWDVDAQGTPRMANGTLRWIVIHDGKESDLTWHWQIDSEEFGAAAKPDKP